MRLTDWERDRLTVFTAAELARRHREAGLRLSAPEAIALMCDAMFEAARAGGTLAEVTAAGHRALGPEDVMDGVRELVPEVRLEVLLDDGTRLAVLLDPLADGEVAPAEPETADEPVASEGHDPNAIILTVRNTSRRVVRVSSHFPFDRVNHRLEFDRERARGHRLDLPAGSSVRWEPGAEHEVRLVPFRGESAPGDRA